MKVSVVGLGYIGLPTAAMFAAHGVQVHGVEVNADVVETINAGRIHIVEPGLEDIVKKAVASHMLVASLIPEPADAFLIAVPTPFMDGHKPDLSYIESAARTIAPVLKAGDLVVLESTSPVGATEQMVRWLAEERPDLKFPGREVESGNHDVHVAHCPERVLPGQVIRELVENDRIIGGMTPRCSERAIEVYRTFVKGELLVSDARTAEMGKLTENAFRDVNIAFANELSLICDKLDINVWELISLANHHPRVNVLKPGCGVGGHCIAVDPWFIVDKTPEQARLIHAARQVNDGKPEWVVQQAMDRLKNLQANGKSESELTVALLGLAFKPDIDDLRTSPAIVVARKLHEVSTARILCVEPNIELLPAGFEDFNHASMDTALEQADVIVVLVAHTPFVEAREALSSHANVIDACGVING